MPTVYYPALLFSGSWGEIALAAITGGIGVVALAGGLEGYFLKPATWPERGLFIAAAFLLIDPGLLTDLAGFALLAVGLGMQRLRRGETAVAQVGAR